MEYLVIIFVIVLIIGILGNRELARDRKRIHRMMREYSFKTYSPKENEEKDSEKEEKKGGGCND
ncbi:MAG: hypothetical protein AB1442_14910 [Nitrospirota bacterium]